MKKHSYYCSRKRAKPKAKPRLPKDPREAGEFFRTYRRLGGKMHPEAEARTYQLLP